ncbi:MAG: hypothetical protein ACLSFT_10445 [Ruminococcus callidus]
MAYAKFTPEMKKTYTILAPNMLPIHFHLLIRILEQFGYHVVLLESTSRTVVEEGLKNVHNDTCYPALLVVGQFMEALKSGKYDVDHTALLITQTGGGCRASNYIHLLRKCMAEQFRRCRCSLNFAGLEKDCSLELTPALCLKMVYAVLYADLLMTLYNQCRPYELNEGESQQVLDAWQEKLPKLFGATSSSLRKDLHQILKDFAAIPAAKSPRSGWALSARSTSSIRRWRTIIWRTSSFPRAVSRWFPPCWNLSSTVPPTAKPTATCTTTRTSRRWHSGWGISSSTASRCR